MAVCIPLEDGEALRLIIRVTNADPAEVYPIDLIDHDLAMEWSACLTAAISELAWQAEADTHLLVELAVRHEQSTAGNVLLFHSMTALQAHLASEPPLARPIAIDGPVVEQPLHDTAIPDPPSAETNTSNFDDNLDGLPDPPRRTLEIRNRRGKLITGVYVRRFWEVRHGLTLCRMTWDRRAQGTPPPSVVIERRRGARYVTTDESVGATERYRACIESVTSDLHIHGLRAWFALDWIPTPNDD